MPKSLEQGTHEHQVMTTADGRTWRLRCSPLADDQGNVHRMLEVYEDISEMLRIRKAQRKAEEHRKLILDTMQEILVYHDQDLRIQWTSKAASNFSDKKAENIVGQKCYKIWHQRETPCENCPVLESMKTGKAHETERYSPNGHWYSMHGYPVHNEQGELIGGIEYGFDITQRKEAENALQAKVAEQALLLDTMDAQVWYLSDVHTYGMVNRAHTAFMGMRRDELENKKLTAIFPPAIAAVCEKSNTQVFETKKAVHTEEWIRDDAGENHLLRISKTPKLDAEGEVEYVVCVGFDITERKRAEEKILRQDRYLKDLNKAARILLLSEGDIPFQQVVEHIGPASDADRAYIFLNHHDPDGNLLMSQKAEWCAEGITSQRDNPLLQNLPYDNYAPYWQKTLAGAKIINEIVADSPMPEREVLQSQNIRAVMVIPIIIDKKFFGFVGFDNCHSEHPWDPTLQAYLHIATRNLAQTIKRRQSEHRVRESLKEKEVLLREIHHRVKNNMQVIISLLRMHERKNDDTRLGEIFDDCRNRIDAMALIHETLYQSDDMAQINFEIYLKKLCRNLSQAHGARGKGITVMVDRCDVELDMDQGIAVGMVIAELISNAFKHAFPKGNKGGKVSIGLARTAGQEVEITIADDGKGLPPEIDIMQSHSLGLRLVTAAVTRELAGSIHVARNGGTQFIVRFPCKKNSAQ